MFYLSTAGCTNSLLSEGFQIQAQSKRMQLLQGIPTSPIFIFVSYALPPKGPLRPHFFLTVFFFSLRNIAMTHSYKLVSPFSCKLWLQIMHANLAPLLGSVHGGMTHFSAEILSWGFAVFSSFNKNNLGKEIFWSIKKRRTTETLKKCWAYITWKNTFVTLAFMELYGTSALENRQTY